MPRATCRECGNEFEFRRKTQLDTARGGDEPPHCGKVQCRMRHGYTAEDWAARARMAEAKLAAETMLVHDGYADDYNSATRPFASRHFKRVPVVLDEIDQEALRRASVT
jgi:hypothetical protein